MHVHSVPKRWLALACLLFACGNDGGDPGADTGADDSSTSGPTDPSGNPSGSATGTPSTTASSTTSAGTSTTDDGDDTSGAATESSGSDGGDSSGSEDSGTGDALYEQSFDGPDGAPWPPPWEVVGAGVLDAGLDDGRGRMQATTMHTGRIILPGYAELDVEAYATVVFEDPTAQGFGFYVRQNGGALQDTNPPGQGYAVYLEGSFMRAVGIWRETNGVEEPLMETPDAVPGGMQAGVPYRVRLQCQQSGELTALRAKVWPAAENEPAAWTVQVEDGTPELQHIDGSFAVDAYNYAGTGSIWIDDIQITRL